MEQSDTDWDPDDWSVGDQTEIDAMIDAYKKEEIALDSREGAISQLKGFGDDYDDDSGESDETGDEENMEENGNVLVNSHHNGTSHYTPHREGFATCEFCGRVGVKHAFYSKSKRFCSLACSRSFSASAKDSKNKRQGDKFTKNKSQKKRTPQTLVPSKPDMTSYDWSDLLNDSKVVAAPVSCFKHCPMSDSWDSINIGMKMEVINSDCDLPTEVYWIAVVIKIAGYRALMRYEGFGSDASHDFWVNLCIKHVHPVGWCATHGKPLVPPQTIQHKFLDWKDFLVKRLTGARTLPHSFYDKVVECVHDHPIKPGMHVEVVDKMCVSAMRVATIDELIGGRLRMHYEDSKTGEKDEFWCHRESSLVHPVGWSQLVGHKLHSTPEYKTESLNKIALRKYDILDTSPDMFPKTKELGNGLKFQPGMKLEAIDPLNLSTICVATVRKVLRNNYLMIGIDGSIAENGSDWFCYHATSPCIFPVGFCEINNLQLTPPRNYKGSEFKWFDYLKATRSIAAPVKLFQKEIPKHGFRIGMKLEAVDLMEPRLICVGTVTQVVGRLLRIHFDGWETNYDQWIDCESPDIYVVGWCEMVGFHLEGPRPKEASPAPVITPKKRKSKTQIYRGPRKKRKPKLPMAPLSQLGQGSNFLGHGLMSQAAKHKTNMSHQSSLDTDDVSQDSNSTSESFLPQGGTTVEQAESHDTSVSSLFADKFKKEAPVGGSTGKMTGQNYDLKEKMDYSEGCVTSQASDAMCLPAAATSGHTMTDSNTHNTSPVSSLIASPLPGGLPMASTAVSPKAAKSGLPGIATVLNLASPGAASISAMTLPTTSMLSHKVAPVSSPSKLSVQLASAGSPVTVTQLNPSSIFTLTTQNIKPEPRPVATQFAVQPVVSHHIPRVIPGEPDKDSGYNPHNKDQAVVPEAWNVHDVCQFLRINDCGAHCDSFSKKNINGRKFMTLSKEQIVNLTGMKVGPSLKIYDLIQQLKITVATQQASGVTTPPPSQHPQAVTSPGRAGTSHQMAALHSPALKAQLTQNSQGMPLS